MNTKRLLAPMGLFVLSMVAFAASAHGFHFTTDHLAMLATAPVAAAPPEGIKAELERINSQVSDFINAQKSVIEDGAKLAKSAKDTADELLLEAGRASRAAAGRRAKMADVGNRGGDVQDKMNAGMAFEKFMDEHADVRASPASIKQGQTVNVPMPKKRRSPTGHHRLGAELPGTDRRADRPAAAAPPDHPRPTCWPGGRTDAAAIFLPEGKRLHQQRRGRVGRQPEAGIRSDLHPDHGSGGDHRPLAAHLSSRWRPMPALVSYINGRLTYGLKLVEENQLLNGSGTGGNLEGIYTAATLYANTTSLANETDIGKIRLAILQAELAYAEVNGIVLHPTNWALME